MNRPPRPSILIVEDEPELIQGLRTMMKPYDLEILEAETARAALEWLLPKEPDQRPGALILDIMLPYGDKATRDSIAGPGQDEENIGTGLGLLKRMRQRERDAGWPLLWTAVTTARSAPTFLDEIRTELNGRGRIFSKPYDDMLLEVELCRLIGLECKLDPAFVAALDVGDSDGFQ